MSEHMNRILDSDCICHQLSICVIYYEQLEVKIKEIFVDTYLSFSAHKYEYDELIP